MGRGHSELQLEACGGSATKAERRVEEAERGSGPGFGGGEVIQICHLLILAGLKSGNAKEGSNYRTVALTSHASK